MERDPTFLRGKTECQSVIDDSLNWLKPLSPLHWATAGAPLNGQVPATYLALVAMAAVFIMATLVGFERHDLR